MTALSFGERKLSSGGCVTGNEAGRSAGSQLSPKTGMKLRRNFGNGFRPGTEIYWKLSEEEKA
jgi:hypothetical protein